MKKPRDFVAIDFETANRYPNSACAIGMVKVIDNRIVETFYSLICPPYLMFDPGNIRIHGIRPSDVADEPTFKTLWPQVEAFIGNLPLVAHNAPFDKKVLQSVMDYYDLEPIENQFFCTVKLARQAYPHLSSHRLNIMAEYLDLNLNHHQALDDARVCAEILITINQASH